MPGAGRSASSQRAERSRIDKVAAAKPTTIKMSGPLTKMLTAIAVQNTATKSEPRRSLVTARRKIDAGQYAHGENDRAEQHGVGFG